MDSKTYQSEKENLLIKEITIEEAREISRKLWGSDRVKQLIKELREPLDEYVRVYVGLTGQTEINEDQFVEFITEIATLRKEIEEDQSLIEYYKEIEPVERATPLLAVAELGRVMVMSLVSGLASSLGGTLVNKFLKRKKERKDVLIRMSLSSPVLSVLSNATTGLTIPELAEKAHMSEGDVGYFLAKYEDQKWVTKERIDKREIWIFNKDKMIEDFES